MGNWTDAYKEGFEVGLERPSTAVRAGRESLTGISRILDIGCGKGRNSIYAATFGHAVDAVDIEDLDFLKGVDPKVSDRIIFYQDSMFHFPIELGAYKGIILTRIIQYVSPDDLPDLISACVLGLEKDGLLMMCYTSSGGLPQERLSVPRWEHSLDFVTDMLFGYGMELTFYQPGPTTTSCPGPKYPVKSHDMVATKKPNV